MHGFGIHGCIMVLCWFKFLFMLMLQRYEIINGVTEVEGAAEEATEIDASAEGNKSGGCLQSAITQISVFA